MIHQRNLLLVRRRSDARRPADPMPRENTDLASPRTGKLRSPDLIYVPIATVEPGGKQVPAEPLRHPSA
ncbi:hypothetical protein ACFVYP_05965 [Kitasatospora sp. NPDC058201]|uniref:hypothetical protein n=1 Tax=unclassified Kitasatospora TaxID=2633591 RepID=UPI003650CFA3